MDRPRHGGGRARGRDMNNARRDAPDTPTTVVAVHGNGGGASRFDRLLGRQPDRIRIDAVTLPGFGGVPADPALHSVADYADRLGDLVAVHDQPILLGHGIGGSIALDLASRRPDLLGGLILHAPVAANLDRRLFPRVMATRPMRSLARRLVAARPFRPLWRRLFFPSGAPRETLDRFFDGYRHCEAFGQMFEIIDARWFEGLEPVRDVPTVLLWGEHDRVLRSGQSAAVTAKLPNADVVLQPGWDHFPMIEQPEEYARAIAELAVRLASTPR